MNVRILSRYFFHYYPVFNFWHYIYHFILGYQQGAKSVTEDRMNERKDYKRIENVSALVFLI